MLLESEAKQAEVPEGPAYLLPIDPNQTPFSNFLPPASNFNPLNPNSQYQAFRIQQGGGPAGSPAAAPAVPSGNPEAGIPTGGNTQGFLEVATRVRARQPSGDNPTYVLPVDPYSPPFSNFLPPGSDFNPIQPNAQYQAFRSGQQDKAGDGLPTTPQAAPASVAQQGLEGAAAPAAAPGAPGAGTQPLNFIEVIEDLASDATSDSSSPAMVEVGADPVENPTYLLPTDPNAPPFSNFLPPGSNINPINPNSQWSQSCKGQSCNLNTVGPGNLQAGAVPVGVASGNNVIPSFPQ